MISFTKRFSPILLWILSTVAFSCGDPAQPASDDEPPSERIDLSVSIDEKACSPMSENENPYGLVFSYSYQDNHTGEELTAQVYLSLRYTASYKKNTAAAQIGYDGNLTQAELNALMSYIRMALPLCKERSYDGPCTNSLKGHFRWIENRDVAMVTWECVEQEHFSQLDGILVTEIRKLILQKIQGKK